MSNETPEYAITDAKTSYDAFKYLVDSRSTILKISTPKCIRCEMATRWTKSNGFHDGVDYVEVNLGDLDKPDEALAYLRQVVSTAFGVNKISKEGPWFINLRNVPKTTTAEGGEMVVSEPPAIDFDSPALQLFGFQPSNLPTLFNDMHPAQEQGMYLVA